MLYVRLKNLIWKCMQPTDAACICMFKYNIKWKRKHYYRIEFIGSLLHRKFDLNLDILF